MHTIHQWLTQVLQDPNWGRFSDLHLHAGHPAHLRVDGVLHRLDGPTFAPDALDAWRFSVIDTRQRQPHSQHTEIDSVCTVAGQRLRLNFYQTDQGPAVVMRRLSAHIPSLDDLGLPAAAVGALAQASGLILVAGPTGSGKSTTLAAMVRHLHEHKGLHTITLEDPIEYRHQAQRGTISQRQVGRDTDSFASGLRSALRQDPDVILVGELRDAQTIGLALTAAETGHLVLATLHTRTASGSVTRIIDSLPPEQQNLARLQLADSLQLVMCQELLPRAGEVGRIAAYEVLVCTPAIRHLIREHKTFQIDNAMQTAQADGMQTMAQARQRLKQAGQI